ncbi:MAG: hypothetical protein ACYCO3_17055, partial [Mycobacteriales bacterium]
MRWPSRRRWQLSPTLTGTPPDWVGAQGRELLLRRFGARTFERGALYARRRAVTALTCEASGQLLVGHVIGHASQPYRTFLTAPAPGANTLP